MSEAVVFIPLSQGKVAVIDFEDFDKVRGKKWYAARNGRTFYARRAPYSHQTKKQSVEMMHRVILDISSNVDHINGDGLDNRRGNLRPASTSQNGGNRKKSLVRGYSKYKGVTWNKNNLRWLASIKIEGKTIFLGYQASEIAAAECYDKAAREFFGEYARTNF